MLQTCVDPHIRFAQSACVFMATRTIVSDHGENLLNLMQISYHYIITIVSLKSIVKFIQ